MCCFFFQDYKNSTFKTGYNIIPIYSNPVVLTSIVQKHRINLESVPHDRKKSLIFVCLTQMQKCDVNRPLTKRHLNDFIFSI